MDCEVASIIVVGLLSLSRGSINNTELRGGRLEPDNSLEEENKSSFLNGDKVMTIKGETSKSIELSTLVSVLRHHSSPLFIGLSWKLYGDNTHAPIWETQSSIGLSSQIGVGDRIDVPS